MLTQHPQGINCCVYQLTSSDIFMFIPSALEHFALGQQRLCLVSGTGASCGEALPGEGMMPARPPTGEAFHFSRTHTSLVAPWYCARSRRGLNVL